MRLGKIALWVFLGLLGIFVLIRLSLVKVGVNEVGVHIVQYDLPGMTRGVEPKDYGPGWHRDLGPVDGWVLLDARVQTLEMTDSAVEPGKRKTGASRPRAADGYEIPVDITVKYRIKPGEAHKLYQKFPKEQDYHDQVRQKAEGSIRTSFGELTAEQFYDSHAKRKKASEAKAKLQVELDQSESHVEVLDVLVRDVTFPPQYEQQILAKKLRDQDAEVSKAKQRAAVERLSREKIERETEAKLGIIEKQLEAKKKDLASRTAKVLAEILADAHKYETEKTSDADLESRKLEAQGTPAKKEAEAEGTRLKNEAVAGPGGRALVALEAAKRLELGAIEISTVETDLLDVDAMLRKLGLGAWGAAPEPKRAAGERAGAGAGAGAGSPGTGTGTGTGSGGAEAGSR